MKKFILYFLLMLVPAGIFAQETKPAGGGTNKPEKQVKLPDNMPVKKKSGVKRITRQWTLSSDYTDEISVPVDTAFSFFHRSRKTDKCSDFNIYPGSYGQPVYQLDFFDRDWQPDQYLYSHYKPFMFTPDNPVFINTQVPFTELAFTYGGEKSNAEQTFRIRHSQNVNKDLNFGFIYDIVYNLGQYNYQRTRDKDFLFHSSYNGEKYTAYFTAGVNNLMEYENGGIEGKDYLKSYSAENVPVMLGSMNKAQTFLRNRHIMLIQRYSPGERKDTTSSSIIKSSPITFSLISCYEWTRRRYNDNYPGSSYYDTVMISNSNTSDSLFQGLLSNTFRIDLSAGHSGKFKIGAGAGIRSELRRFGQIMPGDTLTRPDTTLDKRGSLVLTGKVFNNIGEKFGWVATGDLWFQGYRAGDFKVDGRIFKNFSTRRGDITWDATGTLASYTPSYWYSSWGANSLLREYNTAREFRMMAGSSITYPAIRMSLRFNYAIIDNYIYLDEKDSPEQHSGGLSVASLELKKEFVVWKLHWDNLLLVQKSSNSDIVSLPLGAIKSSFFLEHTFHFSSTNGSFDMQLGAETIYHTPYYAYGYAPVTGDYYNQKSEKTGDYPFVNAFINLKLKRTRFFIMADHLNSGYSGYNYFLVPGYPMNVRMLRYGLAWTFYN